MNVKIIFIKKVIMIYVNNVKIYVIIVELILNVHLVIRIILEYYKGHNVFAKKIIIKKIKI